MKSGFGDGALVAFVGTTGLKCGMMRRRDEGRYIDGEL
jgi:hypothetical protein